jgi:ABC-2 type transport system ATP-binding protein
MAESRQRHAIAIADLVVLRGGARVLDGVSAVVRAGSVTGLLGPSGAGKTTLMRAVAGVQRIHSGTVRVLGRRAGDAALRSQIGYLTQAPAVYTDITVRENLRYFATVAGAHPHRVTQVLDAVALTEFANRIVARLSGGQRARVSLAVALVADPPLLVLDEPTVGLDPVLRRDLWQLFHRLAAAGTTVLVSSHVMDEARRCTDLLLLRDGRLVAADTPQAIGQRAGTEDLDEAFCRLIESVSMGSAGAR